MKIEALERELQSSARKILKRSFFRIGLTGGR